MAFHVRQVPVKFRTRCQGYNDSGRVGLSEPGVLARGRPFEFAR